MMGKEKTLLDEACPPPCVQPTAGTQLYALAGELSTCPSVSTSFGRRNRCY